MGSPGTSNPKPTRVAEANSKRKVEVGKKTERCGEKCQQRRALTKMQADIALAELSSKDLADANNHLTDYYNTQAHIAEDTWDAANEAIDQFFLTTQMPQDRLTGNIAYQLVRIVLGTMPATSAFKALFESLEKYKEVAKALTAVSTQRTAAGVYSQSLAQAAKNHESARNAKDFTKAMAPRAKQLVLEELAIQREALKKFAAEHPELRGSLYPTLIAKLGAIPKYDAEEFIKFQTDYEIKLYQETYAAHAMIVYSFRSFFHPKEYWVEGIPDAVLDRLVELTGAASPVAAVLSWNLRQVSVLDR